MVDSDLHHAVIDKLRDTYDAERQLTKALGKLAKAANSQTCVRRLKCTRGNETSD